jgi:hypothetical protein
MRLGLDQSVGSIGSHTTKTRIGDDWLCFSRFSIAEAPRRQVGQVGDNSKTKRTSLVLLLKSRLNWSRLLGVSDVSGGWPGGVPFEPQRYQTIRSAVTIAASQAPYLIRAIDMSSPSNQARYRLREKDDAKNDNNSQPEQGDAQRAAPLALIAPDIQLDEADNEQNGCACKQPRTARLQPHARSRQSNGSQKAERQATCQSSDCCNRCCNRSCPFCHAHGTFTPSASLPKPPSAAPPLMEPRCGLHRGGMPRWEPSLDVAQHPCH